VLQEDLLIELLGLTEAQKEEINLLVSLDPQDGHSTGSLILDKLTKVSNFLSHFLH